MPNALSSLRERFATQGRAAGPAGDKGLEIVTECIQQELEPGLLLSDAVLYMHVGFGKFSAQKMQAVQCSCYLLVQPCSAETLHRVH